jgi:hypothetical protein
MGRTAEAQSMWGAALDESTANSLKYVTSRLRPRGTLP